MSNLNSVHIQGNLTKDPEVFGSDKKVTRFTVAVNNGFGDHKTTAFVNCVAFGKTGELIAEHFQKGKAIIVKGSLHTNRWETQEGEKRSSLEVQVDMRDGFFFQSGGGNRDSEGASEQEAQTTGEKLF